MERNFGEAVEPNHDDTRSRTNRRVAEHIVVLPGSRAHAPGQHRIESDGNGAREANLPSVRMAAQEQIEPGMGRLAIDFRRM